MRSFISRTATFAWSPTNFPAAEPLIATGTLSGALDENFSNDSVLEIWKPQYGEGEVTQPIASTTTNARFNRVAWGYVCPAHPMGVIAAGLESGELILWDAKRIIERTGQDPLILRNNQHSGPIKGLHFNPKQPNLLASGGVKGEIFIWDLGNPGKPYSPGARSSKLDEITSLSWNSEVAHILATSSSSGYTVVWDLRHKKELTALAYGGGAAGPTGGAMNGGAGAARRGMGALCWHPEQPTRLATASDDDQSPVVMLWDLRNARAPEKVLAGHNGGVLSLSWCKQDADLLLSCGKDNRSICWNPQSGQAVGELPASQNWSYDVQFCPKNPNLVAVASFDGRISINSLQDTNPEEQPVDVSTASTDVNDIFASLPAQSEAANRGISLTQPPKWLKKPISATFGFGGQLVSVSNLLGAQGQTQSSVVHLREVQTEPTIAARAKRLQQAIDSQSLADFCAERSNDEKTRIDDVANWKALQTLFTADSRDELVALLGFSKEDVAAKVASSIGAFRRMSNIPAPSDLSSFDKRTTAAPTSATATSAVGSDSHTFNHDDTSVTSPFGGGAASITSPTAGETDLFGSRGDDAADLFSAFGQPKKSALPDHLTSGAGGSGLAAASAAATAGSPGPSSVASENIRANTFRIYPDNESELDKLITRALVLGDFEAAVSLCLSTERHADALLLAVRGGAELLAKTQKAYFERKTASLPYLRLFQSIVGDDLTDVVQNADLNEWQEIFVVICTFAKRNEDFTSLAEQLGQRLEFQYTTSAQSSSSTAKEHRKNAVLCYLAAGKLEKVAGMWIDEMKEEESVLRASAAGGYVNGNGPSSAHTEASSLYSAHAEALQTFMEKITVFQSAVQYVDTDLSQPSLSSEVAVARTYKLSALYDRMLEYADLLADQGLIASALKYIGQTPQDYRSDDVSNAAGLARDRLQLPDYARTGAAGISAAASHARPAVSATSAYAPHAPTQTSYGGAYGAPDTSAYQAYGAPAAAATTTYNGYAAAAPATVASAYAPSVPAVNNVPAPSMQQAPSAYAPVQPLVPAPPPPIIAQSDAGAGIGGGGGVPLPSGVPPPPPKKADGGWNDIPSNLAPKRTSSAMSNRSHAQPITSPFPHAPSPASQGALPPSQGPPPPGFGGGYGAGASAAHAQVAPPPRGMQAPPGPPRGITSPPPMGQYGRPPMGQPLPPSHLRSPPPTMRPPPMVGPPRGGTPAGLRPGTAGGTAPPSQPPQPTGPYAPAPGQVSVPPPPGPISNASPINNTMARPPPPAQQPPQHNPYGPPPVQQAPQQQPQQGLMSPPRSGQAQPPPPPFARPPMPAIPRSGTPAGAPLRSVTPGAGAGPPPRSATPANKAALKYPPGDRTHIPESAKPIAATLSKELARFKSILPPAQKRTADDVDKRVNSLLDLLNCSTLEPRVVQGLHGICQSIEQRNQQAALSQHVQLASTASGEVFAGLVGVKQVLLKLNQG